VTLNRPDRLNALGRDVNRALREAENDFAQDEDAWVLIYTGTGRAFSAGVDLKDRVEAQNGAPGDSRPLPAATEVTKPTMAAVNGLCYGAGFELTQRLDVRICSESATFAMPEAKIGVVPHTGIFYLPRLIGRGDALWMMLSGAPVDAQAALRMGLVTRVVPDTELMSTAVEMAELICANGPLAVRLVRSLVRSTGDIPIEAGQKIAAQQISAVWAPDDSREGMWAFVQKRQPAWTGR
jgi:E-phenylitaconyl-CoA hydratase